MQDQLTEMIIEKAIAVQKALGPGLLESAYKECLAYELIQNGIFIENEKPLPLIYKEIKLECGYRADLLIERQLVLEIKSVDALNDLHLAQMLTYLKLANCRIGLLINFNVLFLKDGVRRVING